MIKKTNFYKLILLLIGSILILISIYLAAIVKFKNFYEILLIGILCLLFLFKSSRRISINGYIKIYLFFFILGIIGDLVMALGITHLWVYNYLNIWQYILLYVLIYPVGGLTVVLCFLVFLDLFNVKLNYKNRINVNFIDDIILAIGLSVILTINLILYEVLHALNYVGLTIFGSITIVVFLLLNIHSKKKHKFSMIHLINRDKLKVITAGIISVFLMALLHEVPNVIAGQWVYMNLPLEFNILGVPLIVLLGWPILLIIPLASFLTIYSEQEIDSLIKDDTLKS